MRKPEIGMTDIKLFIKHKSGFLVTGWTANKGNELHGDYEYVSNREEGERTIKELEFHCHKSLEEGPTIER